MTTTKTATLVKTLDDFKGDAALYKLDPPLEGYEYVIASAVTLPLMVAALGGDTCETYLFPADRYGAVVDWGELHGSIKGVMDHEIALNVAGYELTEDTPTDVRDML